MNQLWVPKHKRLLDWPEGVGLLATLVSASLPIARSCGGDGICGTCLVEIKGPRLPPPDQDEIKRLPVGCGPEFRLACFLTSPAGASKTWEVDCSYW